VNPALVVADKGAGTGYGSGMRCPFPGMDPYLEAYWESVHARLVVYACDRLAALLPPDLYARTEERVFLETETGAVKQAIPDNHIAEYPQEQTPPMLFREGGSTVAEPEIFEISEEPITQSYIEIREAGGGKVITVLEFLSPTNKVAGPGQAKYVEKQERVLRSDASLVEIDLIRSGNPTVALPAAAIPAGDVTIYAGCISRGWKHNARERYLMPLRQRLPAMPVPLRKTEKQLSLDLQQLLDQTYAAGRYDHIDYRSEPVPPLPPKDAEWADQLLKAAGLR